MLLALAAAVSAADPESKIVLTPSETDVSVGETFTVTIEVENFEDFNTAMFYDVKYDEEYLEWTGGSWQLDGAALSDYVMESNIGENGEQGRSGVFYTANAVEGAQQDLVTLEFTVLKESAEAQTVGCSVILKDNETELSEGIDVLPLEVVIGEEEPEIEKFNIAGTTMTLGNSLALEFAIDITKVTGDDNYALITKKYADGREDLTMRVDQSEWTLYSGNLYCASFTGISAKEMCDEVEAVFYNGQDQAITNPKVDSIYSYSTRMLANSAVIKNAKLRTVYVDMLNYGAAAQVQLGYDVENLANRSLTDTQKGYATQTVEVENHRVSGTGYAGTTLNLKSQILLEFVFEDSVIGKNFDGMYALATYTNHRGAEHEIRIEGSEFIKYSSKHHLIAVSGMAVADCRQLVTCTVYNADGEVITSASDSVESYVARNINSIGDVVNAIMKFGTSSYNYFHS